MSVVKRAVEAESKVFWMRIAENDSFPTPAPPLAGLMVKGFFGA
ncbi:MAG: hypothetical protein ACR2IK_01055 [Chloroflexota bacterium]